MSRAFICDHCERLYVSYRGMIDLLDMDNIQCRKGEKLAVIPIDACNSCEEASWEDAGVPSYNWDLYNSNKETTYEENARTECEYNDSGEQENYMCQLLEFRGGWPPRNGNL